jgi:hypothetical protein
VSWAGALAKLVQSAAPGSVDEPGARLVSTHSFERQAEPEPELEPEPEANMQQPALQSSQAVASPLPPGKKHHFFLCHHQGSGGDQAYNLYMHLTQMGYSVWYDNGRNADHRNLQGMKQGVRDSVCLLIFLSGRRETDGQPDVNGRYEGPFTRWFCHEEMSTAHAERLRCVGVMEDDERHGKPDFGQEKQRALTGAEGGQPVNGNAARNIHLLDDVCFIPLRRQQHEVEGMMKEIVRQYHCAAVLEPHAEEGVPPSAAARQSAEPEPEQ